MRKIEPLVSPILLPFLVMIISFSVALPITFFIKNSFIASAIVSVVISILFYVFYKFVVENYLNERIKVLYKNIHRVKTKGHASAVESIDMAEQEVDKWESEYKFKIDEFQSRENYRREYIGNVSHELKTPIFNIQGYILTLLDGGLEDPEINKTFLQRANKSVDRMIDLIQDMDTLNKLESGIMNLKPSNFDIVELVKDAVDLLEQKAKKANVSLNINFNSGKSIMVFGDPNRIEQILFNLIINAIKYRKDSSGQVELAFHDMDERILIDVKDDGKGIAKKDLDRIFERFYRIDKSRARESGGSGLGLSIVKHILDQHGESINVRSEVGKGSTFSFTLKKAQS